MQRVRRRVAIGVFATRDDAQVMVVRLAALGVTRDCLLTAVDDEPPPLDRPDQSAIAPPGLTGDRSGRVALRVSLETLVQEQVVTRALLESVALSVELHDLDR